MVLEDTLPKLLKRNYEERPTQLAMREKDYGIWNKYSWQDVYERVKYFSLGLMGLGLERGDKVSIIGENEPEYFWAEWAVQSAGGAVACIYPDCIPSEVQHIVSDSDSEFAVCEDQEQADKFLEIADKLALLKKVVYWDAKGMFRYDHPMLISFDEVQALGREYEKSHPGLFEESVARGKGSDAAALMYTSGTTGLPKATVASFDYMIDGSDRYTEILGLEPGAQYLSFISPAWGTEQCFGMVYGVSLPVVLNFPEEPETVTQDIREIGAAFLMFAPRQWESLSALVHARMLDANWIQRFFYSLFMPVGHKVASLEAVEHKSVGLFWGCLRAVAEVMLFRPLKDKLGLLKLKAAVSGGSAMGPEVFRFFNALGIRLRNAWGLTEVPFHTMTRDDFYSVETVGQPAFSKRWAPTEIRISSEGEVLTRGGVGFAGYHKKPEESTKKVKDGWFITGDAGDLDGDGNLIYFDRVADLRELSTGVKFPPQFIEIRLRFSPFIRDVLVLGDKTKPYVTALVDIELETVSRWAEKNHVLYTTFTELSQDKAVRELIRGELTKVNRLLPEGSRVKRFANFYKPLDPDEGELTRTRKLRRDFLEKRYSDLIDALYGSESQFTAETEVKYRDGRTGRIKATVGIETIEEGNV